MLVNAYCFDNRLIVKKEKELQKPKGNEVQVRAKLVGICGSDTAVYFGKEHYLGDEMWGHEGLGVVVEIGKQVKDIQIGDIITTYHHPCFWEYYNLPSNKVLKVPEITAKYITQPISCPLNALYELGFTLETVINRYRKKKWLIIGSGFMAYLWAKYLEIFSIKYDIYANQNKQLFSNIVNEIEQDYYDVIVYSSVNDYYKLILKGLKNSSILVHYATPRVQIETNFFDWNWKNIKVFFPSPRSSKYKQAFKDSLKYVDKLDFEKFIKVYDIENVNDVFLSEQNKTGIIKNYLRL